MPPRSGIRPAATPSWPGSGPGWTTFAPGPEPSSPRPTVGCIEWTDPLMMAGNWVPELVEIAGGIDPLGEAGKHSGYVEIERLAETDPDVIAIMPCGFDIERGAREMAPLVAHPEWRQLSAVRSGRVVVTDGNQYFNRPGPRLVESAEILAEFLHPDQFDFGHFGRGWTWWEDSRSQGGQGEGEYATSSLATP